MLVPQRFPGGGDVTHRGFDLTFGIEEEFFLVDPDTRDLSKRVPAAFLRTCHSVLGERVGEELLQPQIELTTSVLHRPEQAREQLLHLRGKLVGTAARFDLAPVCAATHPFAAWEDQSYTDKPRYSDLIEDFQIVGRRNLFCGLHVHVGIPHGHDRVVLMNRMMRWVPLFLALSTSSPYWQGRSTGLLSYRQAAYDEWPRSGIPDAFAGEVEYARFVRLLTGCGALHDGSFLWWAIRPSTRFPTLELRVADACTRVEDTLALAAAFRCLVRAHLRRPELGSDASAITRRVIDENRWRAKRYGTDAEFIDEGAGCARGFLDTLEQLLELIGPDATDLACENEVAHLRSIVHRGTSAHAQLAAYRDARERGRDHREALSDVVDSLARATSQAPARPSVVRDRAPQPAVAVAIA
jgi:carboxylate-amine ligase